MARADADQRGGCLNQGGGLGQEGANDMIESVMLVSIDLLFRRHGVYAVLNVASPCNTHSLLHGSVGHPFPWVVGRATNGSVGTTLAHKYTMWCLLWWDVPAVR